MATSKRKNPNQESMSVNEAGRRGGEATSQSHGREFYEQIGHKGGQRVRELINEGRQAEGARGSTRKQPRQAKLYEEDENAAY